MNVINSTACQIFLALIFWAGQVWAQPVTPPGTWAAFPNSALRPAMGPSPPWNPASIFAYSGGWFDEDRNELGVWGGGHADYPGNEVCTFPLSTGAWTCGPRSVFVNDPTTETTADGHPSARHTYSCLARVNAPGYDGVFCHGGSLWRAGWPTAATWFYHRDTATWERLPDRPGTSGTTSLATYAVFDAARNRVLVRARNAVQSFNLTTKAWSQHGPAPWSERSATAAFDPERQVLIVVGAGAVEAWQTGSTPWTPLVIALSGDQSPVTAKGPGLVFDPVGKQYLAHTGGRDLYAINRDTWAVTTLAGAGADPGPQYPTGNVGRFRYVAKTHGLVVVSSIDGSVFYHQLGGGDAPSPPLPPPAADIPARTWVLLPLKPHPGYETGLSPTGGKHISLAWNPDNGRIYFEGGDYYGGSYRQETWSFDVAARLASPTDLAAGWVLEYPFCGPLTQVQPKGPDFVGWTWDTKRHVFWMVPGEMQRSGTQGKVCPSEANLIFRHIMQFDPATKLWTDVAPWEGRDTWSAVYDPATDTIVHARTDKRIGLYTIAANTWTWPPYLAPIPTPDIQKTIWAADLAGRRLFMVDPGRRTLLRWDMDAHTLTPIGTSPCFVPTTTVQGDKGYLVWDSNAKVMIQVCYNYTGAWAYHPDETPPRWEDLSALPVQGTTGKPQMNGLTFDPVKNWLVGIGFDGMWLFRYGQSVAPPPPPPPVDCGGVGQPPCPVPPPPIPTVPTVTITIGLPACAGATPPCVKLDVKQEVAP